MILRNPLAESSAYSGRAERALALHQERGHLIRTLGGATYEVPSCALEGKRYMVRYGGEHESCTCKDFEFGHICKHLLAVGIHHAARRSGVQVRTISAAGDPFKAAKVNRRPMIRKLSPERRAAMKAGLERFIARAAQGDC